ncbi:sulfite exporter TauE/SafE family protein [Undibacterium sp. TJN19]|uniref:sulfite exporter TauE/SafE family protein n=1 Tax=Undibacterium sp. TJN19 TaxID=3413055 RepID=UPI003BF08778
MLTLPLAIAALTAGAAGGIHCVGMCGGISSLLSKAGQKQRLTRGNIFPVTFVNQGRGITAANAANMRSELTYQALLQGGRITSYMLIGAVLGGMGAAGLAFKSSLPVQQIMFFIGNLALIVLGLRLLGVLPQSQFIKQSLGQLYGLFSRVLPSMQQVSRHPFFLGMSWGCLPCGLLYSVVPFSLLAGDAWSGAILMLLFGLSALPHLLLAQKLVLAANNKHLSIVIKSAGGGVLMMFGVLGLWYFDMKSMPAFLCLLPAS